MAAIPKARERRTRQFEHYLGLMEHRTVRLVRTCCYLIFSVPAPAEIRRRLGGAETRFVQFAFSEHQFYLDLPDVTLTPEEAGRAVAERAGFIFALDKPEPRPGERRYDPVQRTYGYGDPRAAAEDAAYVFFDLWGTPLEAWIKVEASAFDGRRRWERGFSMG